jgi:hypothetical protein
MLLPLLILNLMSPAVGVPIPGTLLLPLMLNLGTDVLLYRVQATAIGFYAGDMYGPGEVFDVIQADFSDSTINYGGGLFGWMKIVPSNTPLSNPTGQLYDWKSSRRLVF